MSLKRCKRLEINSIIPDRENVQKAAKIGQILILQFFGSFLSLEWSDSSLVFCIILGILRHKFRVPTKGTLGNFHFWPLKGPCPFWWALCYVDISSSFPMYNCTEHSWGKEIFYYPSLENFEPPYYLSLFIITSSHCVMLNRFLHSNLK